MAQQTAVDWLVNKIYMVIPNEERNFLEGLREQAKVIEKEQIKEAIELPSDEEIENISKGEYYDEEQRGFISGAKWMKEQILNQNK
jgi:hypothetical protein